VAAGAGRILSFEVPGVGMPTSLALHCSHCEQHA